MKKILCFYEYSYVKEEFFKNFKPEEIIFKKGNVQDYGSENNYKNIEILTIFISSIMDKKNIDKFPNLKLILTRSTGTDHIDIDYAKLKNIKVINIKNYGNISVAEYTLALLFEISKKITLANIEVRKNKSFSSRGIHKIETFDLFEKKIGIIGTGNIGKRLAEITKGLKMEILAFDKFPCTEWAQENNIKYVDFDYLLKNSDIISLHLPLSPSTKYFLSKKEFSKMKKNVVILNTSRGSLINTFDFFEALETKKILAAGLDVLENEDNLGRENFNNYTDKKIENINNKIIEMKNVIVTPHNAFNSKEASERRITQSIEEIKRFQKN